MNTAATCPKCGAVVPADAPGGLCPQCLLAACLARSSRAARVSPPWGSRTALARTILHSFSGDRYAERQKRLASSGRGIW